ncbi:iron-sulfur cluster assembly scaffold protein [Candidatus Woesearchaeota archaeon]|nr:iron-sulfur cluster assembly scaffold protein [Candidatus Woesearchaeota archaeon]
MYSKKVMEHFNNPRNVGEMKDADGIGKVGNPRCGDVMWLYIKVEKKEGKELIKDVKFKTFGCVAAIATSSAVTELVKGKEVNVIEKLTKDNVVDILEGLPPIKVHCSILAIEALHAAIKDYKEKSKT